MGSSTDELVLFVAPVQVYVGDTQKLPNCSRGAKLRCSSTSFNRAPVGTNVITATRKRIDSLKRFLVELEAYTRPGSVAGAEGAMKNRYDKLPKSVQGASQMLGRLSPGCEGTNGVFPKCNFGCKPCYHSKSANRVPIDGQHTVIEVARQMELLREQRGGVAHAQLIGGEVTLLEPEDHAKALEVMRFFGRIPMSFTHGDFDYDYLRALATYKDGRKRFGRLDFAAHFDKFMRGRQGLLNPAREIELNKYRLKFLQMFQRLRREYGIRSYCAHNMTIQRGNLGEISQVVRDILEFEIENNFRMLSFQPASETGARQVVGMSVDSDEVWEEIERGVGTRLPYKLFTMGHTSCNRVCFCARFGSRIVPFFDDECEEDVQFRDLIMKEFGNIVLKQWLLFVKIMRVAVTRPKLLLATIAWIGRFVRKCEMGRFWRDAFRLRLVTFVVHSFMNADDVSKAWSLIEQGHDSESASAVASPQIVETIERLLSCSYGMAKTEERRVVPACVQHSVYDEDENIRLVNLLGQP